MRNHRIRTLATSAGAVLVLTLLIVTVASAATIETKTGERYDSVTYTVDNVYKVVKIDSAGTKKNVSFTDIKAVYDDKGNDITVAVLGGYYSVPKEQWKPEVSEVYKEGRRKLWDFGLRIAGNFSVPIGDYYEGIESGVGFEGDIIIPVARELSIRGSVSRAGIKNSGTVVSSELEFHATRYVLSAQFNKPMKAGVRRSGMVYLYSGLGAIAHSGSYGGRSASFTKFLTELGGGGVLFFTESLGLDYGGSLGMVWVGGGDYYSAQTALLLDFKLGLSFWIPTK